jgi:sugar phosphate isomerase/epimerase
MRLFNILSLVVGCLLVGLNTTAQTHAKKESRSLYTYSFGGLEKMEVDAVVKTLEGFNYGGITVESRGEDALKRLDRFMELSSEKGTEFEIYAAYMSHRFDKYGFSIEGHKAAIDRISGKGIDFWVWGSDVAKDGSVTDEKVEVFFKGILDYAISKDVKVVLYPHYNEYYPTTLDALELVEKFDHPSFGIAINLCHELMSDKGPELEATFKRANDKIRAVILSGVKLELDRTSVRTMNASTIHSLEDSEYDLKPFLKLIKESDFKGPVGFINYRLTSPKEYLEKSMNRWEELCKEVGFYK